MDPFSLDGPFGLVPIARHRHKRQAALAELHEEILAFWPECPFHIVGIRHAKRRIVYAPGDCAVPPRPAIVPSNPANHR